MLYLTDIFNLRVERQKLTFIVYNMLGVLKYIISFHSYNHSLFGGVISIFQLKNMKSGIVKVTEKFF